MAVRSFTALLFFTSVFVTAQMAVSLLTTHTVRAQELHIATTTVTISVCGNSTVDAGEQCDVPGETGEYSTTITGRQCTPSCNFGPYCGDGILQTIYTEECDDGNNTNGDFCSASCTIEPAGSGGGGSSGGGTRSSGGSNTQLNETEISIAGLSYPSRTVNILLDGSSVGTVQSNSSGEFNFSLEAEPGASSLGFWATDRFNTRSITFNTTFDVTQGAITSLSKILMPPTITVSDATVNPGDLITLSGQSIPDVVVEVHFDDSDIVEETTAAANGDWSLQFDTSRVSAAEHTVRARSVLGSSGLTTESSFSNTLQLFIGVDGQAITPSDLNRDGRVNLTDFSILIFWWQTNGGDSDPPADINGNGSVSIEDFSIMLFNWNG